MLFFIPTTAILFGAFAIAKPLTIQVNVSDHEITEPGLDTTSSYQHNSHAQRPIQGAILENGVAALSPEQPFKLLVVDPSSLDPIKNEDTEYVLGMSPVFIYPPWVSLVPDQAGRSGNLFIENGALHSEHLTLVVHPSGQLVTALEDPGLAGVRWDVVTGKDHIQNLVPVNDEVAMEAGASN